MTLRHGTDLRSGSEESGRPGGLFPVKQPRGGVGGGVRGGATARLPADLQLLRSVHGVFTVLRLAQGLD